MVTNVWQGPPVLSLRNVTVRYPSKHPHRPSRQPLTNFSLDVNDGELVVVIGDSGAGKSSLLNVIAGFLRPSKASVLDFLAAWRRRRGLWDRRLMAEGSVFINGVDVTLQDPWLRDTGLVMQRFSLYDHLSVQKNLEFPVPLLKLSKAAHLGRIDLIAASLGIADILHERPDDLSGGQQQRVAIGKLLVRDPSVALFDEAFSSLDPEMREHFRESIVTDFLTKVNNERHIPRAAVFVTHNLEDARKANTIVVMELADNAKPERTADGTMVLRTQHTVYQGARPDEAWEKCRNAGHFDVKEIIVLKGRKDAA